MRDGNLTKYNQGKPDFWKKEHQIKVWAVEYQPIGFAVIHKQEALDYFADKQRIDIEVQRKNIYQMLLIDIIGNWFHETGKNHYIQEKMMNSYRR